MKRLNELQNFNFKGQDLRVIEQNDEIWFAMPDISKSLGLSNSSVAIKSLDDDEVTKFNLGGLSGNTNFISEPGLYKLIGSSRKPEAKRFNRWVTHDVLPSIRKTGSYQTKPLTAMDQIKLLPKAVIELDDRVTDLEENQVIPKGDYDYIASRVNKRVSEISHGYGAITQKQRGCLFKDINGGIKQIAGVNSRSNLRKKDYQMVVDFIADWEPSTATKMIIRQTSLDLN